MSLIIFKLFKNNVINNTAINIPVPNCRSIKLITTSNIKSKNKYKSIILGVPKKWQKFPSYKHFFLNEISHK